MAPPVILVCGQDPFVGRSGHPSFTRAQARGAMLAGFEPHIFCTGAPVGTREGDFGTVHLVGLSRLRRVTRSQALGLSKSFLGLDGPRLAAAIARFASGETTHRGPFLVHSISTWGYAGVLTAERLRQAGHAALAVNSVYTTIRHEMDAKVRGLPPDAPLRSRLYFRGERLWAKAKIIPYERRAYQESDLTAVNYESVRRLFLAEYGAGAPIERLPYAAESAFLREPLGERPPAPPELAGLEPADAPLIVSVSRHDPRKGMNILLHALAELRRGGARFRACLTSGGELFEQHRELLKRLDLGRTTVLTNWVPDPFPYLRYADVYVLPSLQEGSGSLALLAALQAGPAVIASGIDGIPEDVTDGDNGLLVPPGQPAALAGARARALGDAALRKRLGRRARETFVERFSAGALADGMRRAWAKLGFPG
ncbi:MAG TPA: glycosyltransferase [Candidatus Limnocylindrales bacterium]|nr:glycosyltransferase [Candidatus Limnocylindrales bacterium]